MFKVEDLIGYLFRERYMCSQNYYLIRRGSKLDKDIRRLSDEDLENFTIRHLSSKIFMISLTKQGEEVLTEYYRKAIESTSLEDNLLPEDIFEIGYVYYYEVIDRFKNLKKNLEPNKKKIIALNSQEPLSKVLIPNTDIFCPSFTIDIFNISDDDDLFLDLVVLDNNGDKYSLFEFAKSFMENKEKFSKEVSVTSVGVILKVLIDR